MTTPLPPLDVRQRLRAEAAYLRGRAHGVQQASYALQRRAQFLRAALERVHENAQRTQLRAAEVWEQAGWLQDVELPAAFSPDRATEGGTQ